MNRIFVETIGFIFLVNQIVKVYERMIERRKRERDWSRSWENSNMGRGKKRQATDLVLSLIKSGRNL